MRLLRKVSNMFIRDIIEVRTPFHFLVGSQFSDLRDDVTFHDRFSKDPRNSAFTVNNIATV
jgi:hypothetical protein